ncbi:site-specific integrase [Pseudoalteromonas peptidolytica]|uniref:site-specific integrase n=1 Tax=Pseudoalteromonas peptidolytica TaxID=61150 RepID=UPI00298EA93E|nr:site-specific integrase [Pseudoalteromonas peptidolytica]MDW7549815.1 site-specific integrase [Pseudoalteromonas peptidolytica]
MSFLGNSKRKTLVSDTTQPENLVELSSQIKVLTDGHSTADFERLNYKGCPVIERPNRRLKRSEACLEKVDMHRRSVVYKITMTINLMERAVRTKINIFAGLIELFRFCDERDIEHIFTVEAISEYLNSLVARYNLGAKGKTLAQKQSTLVSFLKEYDFKLYLELKPQLYEFPRDSQSVKPYTDNELTQLYAALDKIYIVYSDCIDNKNIPASFPLTTSEGMALRAIKANTNKDQWKCDLSRTAYFMTCLYTGINATPLLGLKHSDISETSFKVVSRGVYKLSTVKGRQGGRLNYLDVGFNRRAKEFIKHWLGISKRLVDGNNEFVFPKVLNGNAFHMTSSEAADINAAFRKLGLPEPSSQRFRKTKASIIMRATESIFAVAEGLNNTVEAASKHYADGNPETIELSLASALAIRQQTLKGTSLKQAKEQVAYNFNDPIREQYLRDSGVKSSSISNGLRCTNPFGESAEQLKKTLVQNSLAQNIDTVACFKFLDCFNCPYHAVIAEKQDVWLLLSFRDVIAETLIRPSVNSAPSEHLAKVSNSVEMILIEIKKKFPAVYKEAHELYLESPHPLWSDEDDLQVLAGAYK